MAEVQQTEQEREHWIEEMGAKVKQCELSCVQLQAINKTSGSSLNSAFAERKKLQNLQQNLTETIEKIDVSVAALNEAIRTRNDVQNQLKIAIEIVSSKDNDEVLMNVER